MKRVVCNLCGEDGYDMGEVKGNPICDSCYNKKYFLCQCCRRDRKKKHIGLSMDGYRACDKCYHIARNYLAFITKNEKELLKMDKALEQARNTKGGK